MRYIHKLIPELTEGQIRVSSRFLWFPLTLGQETRWLEKATIQEEARNATQWCGGASAMWYEVKWVPVAFISA